MKTSTLALGLAAGALGTTLYLVGRSSAKAKYRAPGVSPVSPGGTPLGPRALRIAHFIGGLDAEQTEDLREAAGEEFWSWLEVAAITTPDEMVPVMLNPMTITFAVMTETERDEMLGKIMWAIGMVNSLELRSILKDNGVLQ